MGHSNGLLKITSEKKTKQAQPRWFSHEADLEVASSNPPGNPSCCSIFFGFFLFELKAHRQRSCYLIFFAFFYSN
jgi:hypothetical protein